MKINSIILFFLFAALSTLNASAQKEVAEDTLFVDGVCDMCKSRIEEAAYGKGVKYASWDKASRQLVVAYRIDKTSLQTIEQRISESGHATENQSAKKDDYESLPACCQYENLHTH